MGKPLCPIYPDDALIRRLSFRVWLSQPWESRTHSLLPFLWLSFRRKGNSKKKSRRLLFCSVHLPPPETPPACPIGLSPLWYPCFAQLLREMKRYI